MSRNTLFKSLLLPGLLCISGTAMADTAFECITDFEAMKLQFETSAIDAEYECIRTGSTVALFATGASPLECEGEGEWHLEAKAHGANEGSCSMRILGSDGAGCEADRIERQLKGGEAAEWRRFIEDQCQ